jgi:hypothetical protein
LIRSRIHTLINLLQCNFATAANSEDIFSAEPASQESSVEKKVIYVFGGSNMKKVIPHLDSQRFEIRDHCSGLAPKHCKY